MFALPATCLRVRDSPVPGSISPAQPVASRTAYAIRVAAGGLSTTCPHRGRSSVQLSTDCQHVRAFSVETSSERDAAPPGRFNRPRLERSRVAQVRTTAAAKDVEPRYRSPDGEVLAAAYFSSAKAFTLKLSGSPRTPLARTKGKAFSAPRRPARPCVGPCARSARGVGWPEEFER